MFKQRGSHVTIKDVVLANVGMSETEFMVPKSHYRIDHITEASQMLKNAGELKQMINIVGDYDVDGISASSILALVFKHCGWDFRVRLPKRFSEGYGISEGMIDEIESGLIITVDNGITASEVIKKAKEKGLMVIVTDHHLPDATGTLPDADIVIDPNAIEGSADFKSYCGAGIAYKLAQEILGENHELMPKLLGLAAIATVADVMPLVGENRFIVKEGLKAITSKKTRTMGLGALMDECKFGTYVSAKNIAFKIAPMLNAPGRLEDDGAMVSYGLLTSDASYADAAIKATSLSEMNEKRKRAKDEGMAKLNQNMVDNCLFCESPLIFYEPGLLEGLVGILAGQFAEKYRTPCFVFTDSDEADVLKGSGRSYGDVNIKELLDHNAHLIHKYGGHAEAAGVSLKRDMFYEFKDAMVCELAGHKIEVDDTVYYDLVIDASEINNALNELEHFAPFGEGNPEIVFYIKNFSVLNAKYMQEGASVRLTGGSANAVCFDMGKKYQEMGEPKVVDIIGTLARNSFMSNVSNQIEAIEIVPVSATSKTATSMAEMLAKMARERK